MEPRWHIKKLKPYSQALRKNMTDQERHLWYDFLKDLPVTVKRQRIINGYIADFYIPSARLVIELDGSQHYTEDGIEYDSVRNGVMESLGLTVLRYSNAEIISSFSSVCEDILLHLSASKPSPDGVAKRPSGNELTAGGSQEPRGDRAAASSEATERQ